METLRLKRTRDSSVSLRPGRYAAEDLIAGKYQLQTPLGSGGVGTVWLARNLRLDSPVAIKVIRSDLPGEEMVARLLTEARVEANLNHPGIVRVFDFGETESGDSFIVMERLEGRSLSEMLHDEGRLPPEVAVQLILPVLDALCCAHLHGVIHRDLKPENIFITNVDQHRLRPKVLDFGMAKLIAGCDEHLLRATTSGTLMGTAAYMAPEQARGETDVDERSDIWSMCVVLYEAVSGHPAFNGKNQNAMLRAVIEDPIAPLHDQQGGEAALWRILQLGLAKQRGERYASMRELGNALAFWLIERGVHEDVCGQPLEPAWHPHNPHISPYSTVNTPAVLEGTELLPERSGVDRVTPNADGGNLPRLDGGAGPLHLSFRYGLRRIPFAARAVLLVVLAFGAVGLATKLGLERFNHARPLASTAARIAVLPTWQPQGRRPTKP